MDNIINLLENTEINEDYEVFDEEYIECIMCNRFFIKQNTNNICSKECYDDYLLNSS